MTTSIEQQLRERIAELESENKALTERIELIRRKSFQLPDASQLGEQRYRSICSELTGTGLFSDLGGHLWPCWVRLPDDGSFSESERRRHYDNARRYLGK